MYSTAALSAASKVWCRETTIQPESSADQMRTLNIEPPPASVHSLDVRCRCCSWKVSGSRGASLPCSWSVLRQAAGHLVSAPSLIAARVNHPPAVAAYLLTASMCAQNKPGEYFVKHDFLSNKNFPATALISKQINKSHVGNFADCEMVTYCRDIMRPGQGVLRVFSKLRPKSPIYRGNCLRCR